MIVLAALGWRRARGTSRPRKSEAAQLPLIS
jgi:hypothetical protein